MARGYWLSRTDGIFATGKSPYFFDKLSRSFNRRGKNGHTREFFVPQWQVTEQFKAKNFPVEQDIGSDVLEQIAANVDFNGSTDELQDSLNRELKQARKAKILQQTKLISEKLEQRKKMLFAEWSEKFFEQFSAHFGKLRNILISMHLNEEQVKLFNETLQNCIDNLQLNLDNIWEDFNKEKQDETEEI